MNLKDVIETWLLDKKYKWCILQCELKHFSYSENWPGDWFLIPNSKRYAPAYKIIRYPYIQIKDDCVLMQINDGWLTVNCIDPTMFEQLREYIENYENSIRSSSGSI